MINRERIILLLMIVVVAYGAYTYFSDSGDNVIIEGSRQTLAELKNFVVDAATNLSKEYVSASDKYIIEQAEKSWPESPFLSSASMLSSEPFEAKADVVVESVKLSYTGFLQTPEKMIAIVNGIEYETGDQLSETGYFVQKILQTKIVIGMGNSPDTIVIPIYEPVNLSLEEKK